MKETHDIVIHKFTGGTMYEGSTAYVRGCLLLLHSEEQKMCTVFQEGSAEPLEVGEYLDRT